MSSEQTNIGQVIDLRKRILQNRAEGKPDTQGIPREEIRDAINYLRLNRTTAAGATKSKAISAAEQAMPLDDFLSTL